MVLQWRDVVKMLCNNVSLMVTAGKNVNNLGYNADASKGAC